MPGSLFLAKKRGYLNDPIGKFDHFELELRRNSIIQRNLKLLIKNKRNATSEFNLEKESVNFIQKTIQVDI